MATSEENLRQGQGAQPITRSDVRSEVRDALSEFQQFTRNRGLDSDHGGAQLMGENATLRAEKRALKDQVETLEAKVPPAGAVVLKGDDAKLHNDLIALLPKSGKVEDLTKTLKEHGELTSKIKDLERGTLVRDIAEAEGWKASNLLRLTAGMDLAMEEVEEEVDDPDKEGEKKKVKAMHGFLQTKDASGTVTGKKRLSEELTDFLPSLKAEAAQTDTGAESKGTAFVRQPAGRKADPKSATKDVSASYLKKAYPQPKEA